MKSIILVLTLFAFIILSPSGTLHAQGLPVRIIYVNTRHDPADPAKNERSIRDLNIMVTRLNAGVKFYGDIPEPSNPDYFYELTVVDRFEDAIVNATYLRETLDYHQVHMVAHGEEGTNRVVENNNQSIPVDRDTLLTQGQPHLTEIHGCGLGPDGVFREINADDIGQKIAERNHHRYGRPRQQSNIEGGTGQHSPASYWDGLMPFSPGGQWVQLHFSYELWTWTGAAAYLTIHNVSVWIYMPPAGGYDGSIPV